MKKLLLFALILSFSACTIENSPGPAGPPGPPGPAGGPIGPQGPAGPQGATGNANVIGTEPIVLNTWFYNSQQNWYASDINVPEITNEVLNTGLVMVYQRLVSGPNAIWIPLPDTYNNVTTNYDFYQGGLTVYSFNVNNTIPIAPTGMVVRIVVVPASFRKANPDTNWHNFEEAKAILQLPN